MEEVTVLELSTGTSVQNIRELRDYIKGLKEDLDRSDQSLEQNAATAEELRAAQAALRDAMYASTKAVGDLQASTDALFDENGNLTASYNDLVHQLAELKSAWRATDSEMERAALGDSINKVNDQLKAMDAGVGSFVRNVGNYANSFKEAFGDLPPFLGQTKNAVENVTKSLDLVGKQPVLGLVMLLSPVLTKIVGALKENKTAIDAVDKVLKALQPVMDFFAGIVEKIAGLFSQAVDKVLEWAGSSTGAFKTVVSGAVGVGNALLQFILTPIRNVIDGARSLGEVVGKVFKGQFREAAQTAKAAVQEIGENFRKGFDFQGNFAIGKQAGEAFVEGLGSTKPAAAQAGSEVGKAATDAAAEQLNKLNLITDEQLQRLLQQTDATLKARLDAQKAAAAEEASLNAVIADQERALADEINAIWDAQAAEEARRLEEEKARRQQALDVTSAYVDGIANLLGSVADAYEGLSGSTADAENKVKGIRIAAATIQTISGAIAAYMACQTLPPPANFIVGGINAAAVTAAGLANIAKIRSTQIQGGKSSGSAGGASAAVPAFAAGSAVQAPSVPVTAQQTAAIENARNTAELNRSVRDQRVYILQSDLEESGRQVAVRQAESTF